MAWEDLGERLEGRGWLGAGIGTILLAPVVGPRIARGLRPTARRAIRSYLGLRDRARRWLAGQGEGWRDLVAEARAEYEARPGGEGMMELPASEAGRGGSRAAGEREPIPGYDQMNVGEASASIREMTREQLIGVREYEVRNKNRSTLLEELDRRLAA